MCGRLVPRPDPLGRSTCGAVPMLPRAMCSHANPSPGPVKPLQSHSRVPCGHGPSPQWVSRSQHKLPVDGHCSFLHGFIKAK